jgi:hypothetical protein
MPYLRLFTRQMTWSARVSTIEAADERNIREENRLPSATLRKAKTTPRSSLLRPKQKQDCLYFNQLLISN